MPFFRKKPVMIEAVQWNGDSLSMVNVAELAEGSARKITPCNVFGKLCLEIQTLEGDMVAAPGDWIIKGVKGELYPCKPDVFAATYEQVADDEVEEQVRA